MKCVVLLLSLLSVGRSAPVSSCDTLINPITVNTDEILGKWMYVGGSSDLPGSRSLAFLLTSAWVNITTTANSNVLNILQTQRINGDCSSMTYDVVFENSTMLIKEPFYLKEVYLPIGCSDCVLAYEEVISGNDTFTSLLLFSRKMSVSPDVVETLKKEAECLRMSSPIMMDPNNEICPDNLPPSEGLSILNSLLENKMAHRVARVLDVLFDVFVNW
ncbi:uncharacterized protein LOC113024096 [Astatotilapia calliptera]|uniref:uncharacterized protein LOC113024096 n=1 Tax=Astatotilapia calliptera TaxID=8154 RepID=UPI000E418EDF|nr:uncharacterized protein LOC113024096 [Astatotilapia calliptera]